MATLSPNLLGEAVEATASEMVVDGPAFVSFVESVEDTEEHRSQGDDGDFDDSLWKPGSLEIGKDLVARTELAELLTLVEQLDAVVVATPFVIERTVLATTVSDPKA